MEIIKTIKGYDVAFIKMGFENTDIIKPWFCAYVKLKGKLQEEEYPNETFRELNVVGIDTNHYYNISQDLETKYKDAERQITELIERHKEFTNN